MFRVFIIISQIYLRAICRKLSLYIYVLFRVVFLRIRLFGLEVMRRFGGCVRLDGKVAGKLPRGQQSTISLQAIVILSFNIKRTICLLRIYENVQSATLQVLVAVNYRILDANSGQLAATCSKNTKIFLFERQFSCDSSQLFLVKIGALF